MFHVKYMFNYNRQSVQTIKLSVVPFMVFTVTSITTKQYVPRETL